jgi:hypothetical protein
VISIGSVSLYPNDYKNKKKEKKSKVDPKRYGQFFYKAVVDSRIRNISLSFNSTDTDSVAAILPQSFWDSAGML